MSDVAEEKATEGLELAHRVGVLVKPVLSLEERGIKSDGHGWRNWGMRLYWKGLEMCRMF